MDMKYEEVKQKGLNEQNDSLSYSDTIVLNSSRKKEGEINIQQVMAM